MRRRRPALLKLIQAKETRSACPARSGGGAGRACALPASPIWCSTALIDPNPAIRAAALQIRRCARSRTVRRGPLRAGSRSDLERACGARVGARHAAARYRAAGADRDARRCRSARHSGGARQRSSSFARRTSRTVLLQRLKAEDPAVRAAAAAGLGEIKPAERRAGAGRGVSVRPAGLLVFGARRGARRAREVRSSRRDTGAANGAGRQGLGRPRSRRDAAEGARSVGVGRRGCADSSGADASRRQPRIRRRIW